MIAPDVGGKRKGGPRKAVICSLDLDTIHAWQSGLMQCGWDVIVVPGTKECVNSLASAVPGLLVVDSTSVAPGGLELLAAIRNMEGAGTLRVVYILSTDATEEIVSAYRSGADVCFRKPFHARELPELMARLTQ